MLADVAQKVDEAFLDEPVGVVQHLGVAVARIEVEKAAHLIALALQVLADLLLREQRALAALPAGITDQSGAAAHEHDRAVPGELELPQQHDRHQVAELQARRCGIESAVERPASGGEVGVELARVLMHEAPPLELCEEIRHGAESYENPQPLASARRPH